MSARTSPSAKLLWKDAGTYFYVPASGCSEVVQCETAEAAGGEPQQECAWCAHGMRLLVPGSESGKAEAVTADVRGFELCATAD